MVLVRRGACWGSCAWQGLAAPVCLGAACPVPQGAHGLAVDLPRRRNVCDCRPVSAIPAVPAQQTVLGSSKQRVQASSHLPREAALTVR